MNKKQYNNIIFGTVKAEKALKDEPLKMVRTICNNMGVALPQGDCKEVLKTLKAGGFMAWRRCSAREAQAAANSGIAAIAISENSIAMLSADTAEAAVSATDEATATSAVMTLSTAAATTGVEYFSYGTVVLTNQEGSSLTTNQYYYYITSTNLIKPNANGTTYCNIWVHKVLDKCKIPYPVGTCKTMLSKFKEGHTKWTYLSNSEYKIAQMRANQGYATLAITHDHIAIVTPNNMTGVGPIPESVGKVLISQSGGSCFYEKTLSHGWGSSRHDEIVFFYYNG